MTYTLVKRRRQSGARVYYATCDGGRTYTRLARSGPAPDRAERLRVKHEAYGALGALNAGGGAVKPIESVGAGAVVREYLTWARENRPDAAYASIRSCCIVLGEWLGQDRPFCGLGQGDLENWRDWRLKQPGIRGGTVSPNTVRKELALLSGLWDFAVRRNWAKEVVPRLVKGPKPARARRVWGETDQVLAALAAAKGNQRRYAAVYLLAATGLRAGELRSLRWSDVDLRAGTIHVPAAHAETTKHHKRDVPFGRGSFNALVAIQGHDLVLTALDGRRPLTSHLALWLMPFSLAPHSLRRWYQTQLELLQAPSYVIDDLMGHVGKVRAAYAMGTPMELRRPWAEKIDAILSPSWPIGQYPASHPGTPQAEPATSAPA